MSNVVKCILFDLDGTLASTGGAGNRALDKAFEALYGVRESMRNINPGGKTDPAIIREIFVEQFHRDCTVEEMKSVQEKYLEFLRGECEASNRYFVMEGIPELLDKLSSMDVVMGLGTGNLERGARIKLERAGLNGHFPFGGFGSDSEDRAELLKIGRQKAERHCGMKILPENVYIVGDTERDILAARRADFKVIAVATGNVPAESLKEHRPDFLLPDFCDTGAFLKAFNGQAQVQN